MPPHALEFRIISVKSLLLTYRYYWKLYTVNQLSHLINIDPLYTRVRDHLQNGQTLAARSVNAVMVATYWLIGHDIVEEQQQGSDRAAYGEAIISALAERLSQEYGKGFSESTIRNIRQFYMMYKDNFSICYAVRSEFQVKARDSFLLSWTHYRLLMRVKDEARRSFYEKEAIACNLSYCLYG